MKKILIVIGLCIPVFSFCQSSELIDSVNKVIGPDYAFEVDTIPSYHLYNNIIEAYITGNGVKEIVVAASNVDSASELNKIFILARRNKKLVIIDSSAAYYVDGSGPYIKLKGSTLTVTHNFPRGYNSTVYRFNSASKRYFLTKIYYSSIEPNNPDYDHSINVNQVYDVNTQSLALKTSLRAYADDKITKEKTKEISQKLPKGVGLALTKLDDPYNYDVFLTEGKLFNQLMKY